MLNYYKFTKVKTSGVMLHCPNFKNKKTLNEVINKNITDILNDEFKTSFRGGIWIIWIEYGRYNLVG